ncbi:MurR/RpiR family transcriptional regulator [Planctomicrobium sp. SH527]|uniref:MurR/RpiR family transcriptional regulator n=1 Tax=Planctomicrobium sp. SH527 TaxID=3448123 RepID=UPI003F5B026D
MTHSSANKYCSSIDIVSQMQRVEADLSTSERRILEVVRSDFEAATRMTIAELSARAEVSQPTVTRFCRSVGCDSFREFKIRLASTLTVASAYLRSDLAFSDDIGQMAQMVMMRAANAIRECLSQIDTQVLKSVIETMACARRIDLYGQGGGSASLIEDAKLRLFRLGIPVACYVDGHQQRMSAATLRPNDVVFAISNSGRSKSVVQATDIASKYGAKTIVLTRPNTPLATAADMVIPVVIQEDDNVLLPTPSRYAHMAVIDTIATGVAAQLGERGLETLRRVRYTVASIGIGIPTPSSEAAPLLKTQRSEE